MKVNLWKSTLSGQVYEMPLDWLPNPMYSVGWELIGTIEKQSQIKKKIKKVLDKKPGLCYTIIRKGKELITNDADHNLHDYRNGSFQWTVLHGRHNDGFLERRQRQ